MPDQNPLSESVAVRPARLADAQALARLATQLGYPSDAVQIAIRLDGLPLLRSQVYVAEADGGVVGWVHVNIMSSLVVDTSAEIQGMVVDDHHRGQGIGTALLQAAQAWCAGMGCHALYVRSNIVRQRAHEFYLHRGFEHVKTSLTFVKPLA